jgi:hypothetical protein
MRCKWIPGLVGLTLWAAPPETVTYNRDIAPLLYRHCVSCHREGGAGPFPLLTYQDASRRATLLAVVTARHYMPPWKPEPGYGHFRGARGLTASEITLFRRWADGGAPAGDARAAQPALPTNGGELGEPDLVVRLAEPFAVSADGPDLYQCFVIPLNLAETQYVKAVSFQPQNPRLVHHAILFQDPSGHAARERDVAEPGPGYRCFGAPGFLPVGGLGGWSPGTRPVPWPAGVALPLRKGADLVVQIHFHPTGKPESEQSTIGLYFSPQPPTRRLADIPLGSRQIDIPPGERAYRVRDRFTVPVEVDAIGIIPHAHLICKDMKGVALLPNGSKKGLLWIRDWDFNWQEQYRYESPVRLPAGTRVEMEFTYDNSAANPHNPNHPPQRVVWGADTTDEMAGLHVQVLPVREADYPELAQALWGKLMRSVGGGFFRLEPSER